MKRTNSLRTLLLVGVTCFFSNNCYGDVIVDIDSLNAGTTTSPGGDLNGVTTGATWFVPGRGGTYEVQSDAVLDRGFLADDSSPNAGAQTLLAFTAVVGNEIDLNTSNAVLDFNTTTRRTGNNKGLRYEIASQNNTAIARIDWNHNSNQLIVNGVNIGAAAGEGFSSSNLGDTWDSTSNLLRNVNLTFSGNTFSGNFGSQTFGPIDFLDSTATDVGRFRISTNGSSTAAKGVWLDDISLTTVAVPEPSSLAILGLAGSVMAMRRRRRIA